MFWVEWDASRDWITVRQEGVWQPSVIDAMQQQLFDRVAQALRERRRFAVFADCRDYPVQPADVMDRWQVFADACHARLMAPYAILVGSVLNKFQAKRVFNTSLFGVFTSLPEAEAWLLDAQANWKA